MKPLQSLITFWPCHSLEDFPVHYRANDAESLLVSWTALWHPEFLDSAKNIPAWKKAEDAEGDFSDALITIPPPTLRKISAAQLERLREQATVIESPISRARDVLSPVLADRFSFWYESKRRGVAQWFFGLGYAWLQIQLMTRQLRYSSNLDQNEFATRALAAAKAACLGDNDSAKNSITSAFDLLLEEKNRYYPVVANFLDLSLLHPNSQGAPLEQQLSQPHRQCWLSDAELLMDLLNPQSKIKELVANQIQAERLEIVGGLERELPTQILDQASRIRAMKRAKNKFDSAVGAHPKVFARRTPGLDATLPQILHNFGFSGALHLDLAGESVPNASSPLFSWQSPDGSQISAISGVLLDASAAESFLKLGVAIGEQIDSYHSATVVFAHWPGAYHDLFQDLIVANSFGELFGRFQLASDVFDSYFNPGYGDNFDHDDYRHLYLSNAVSEKQVDPISRYVAYWRVVSRLKACRFWLTVWEMISERPSESNATLVHLDEELQSLITSHNCGSRLLELDSAAEQIAKSLCRQILEAISPRGQSGVPSPAVLSFNASGHSVALPLERQNKIELADTPAFGYFIASGQCLNPHGADQHRMIQDGFLQNEFFRVDVDPATGALRSVKRYAPRAKNIFSQQLAYCRVSREGTNESHYSRMRAHDVSFQQIDAHSATVVASGELIFDDRPVANFENKIRIRRGFPDLELEVSLDPLVELSASPWAEYFCNRIAWLNEGASRWRTILDGLHPCRLERFISPQRIVIDDVEEPFWIEPTGLAFHRQSSLRILDNLLIVAGESARRFNFSIRIAQGDFSRRPFYANSASSIIMESPKSPVVNSITTGHAQFFKVSPTWLDILDSRSLIENGKVIGIYLLIGERVNQNGRFTIGGPRDFKRVHAVDFEGNFLHDIDVEDGIAKGSFHGFQIQAFHLYW
jgi:alpha-mannosidase